MVAKVTVMTMGTAVDLVTLEPWKPEINVTMDTIVTR
jgi:hypothetical protein